MLSISFAINELQNFKNTRSNITGQKIKSHITPKKPMFPKNFNFFIPSE